MITNEKANTILDVIETLNELKESGEILDLKYEWDEENNVFDILTVPKQSTKYIQCNFTLTPTGIEFTK